MTDYEEMMEGSNPTADDSDHGEKNQHEQTTAGSDDGAGLNIEGGTGQSEDDEIRNKSTDEERQAEADDSGADEEEEEDAGDVNVASPKCWGVCPRWDFTVKEYWEEVKILLKLAWPNVLYMLLEAMMTIMAVLFSGHLGKNELAAASLANSITTVFTRSVGLGFASSCDTLFTQVRF
ncbi:uncharacterized protein LOC129273283 [Lytechinus pictus]|uniref:uncharacterized protein LOC129273283 n=1 Tax=Lytechinus pictus TaxID=7653 RepID=UPI0030BA1EA3